MILIPCDGCYSRDVQAGFMPGLQYELGIPAADCNGNFGPKTQSLLITVGAASPLSGNLRYLFRAACFFNSPVHAPSGPMYYSASDLATDTLTDSHVEWLLAFQRFSQLPVTGTNDYAT